MIDMTTKELLKEFKHSDDPAERKLYLDTMMMIYISLSKHTSENDFKDEKDNLRKHISEYSVYPMLKNTSQNSV